MHPFAWPADLPPVLKSVGLILIEASYVPQIARLYRVKEAHEFHLLYPILNILGRSLGFTAGILTHDNPLLYGFLLGIIMRFTLLFQVLYYRAREERERRQRLEQVSV